METVLLRISIVSSFKQLQQATDLSRLRKTQTSIFRDSAKGRAPINGLRDGLTLREQVATAEYPSARPKINYICGHSIGTRSVSWNERMKR